MAEIRQDLLSLNYSPSFSNSGMEEADVNLSLPPAVVQGSITGTVTSGSLPLEGYVLSPSAAVSLSPGGTQTETLIASTRTNDEGKYLFGGVLAGTYMIKAKLEQLG